MFIEDNRKDDKMDFGCVKVGECFEYGDRIYLKTEDICFSEITYNAVDLECGMIEDFNYCDVVIQLKNAKITLV